MNASLSFTQDAVFERTAAGQSAITARHCTLSPTEWRLLSVLNGFTSLASLRSMLGEEPVSAMVLHKLGALGLIQHPGRPTKRFNPGWPY